MNLFKQFQASYVGGFKSGGQTGQTNDAAAGSGMAFLQSQFELPDFKIREPRGNITYKRDIALNIGGGFAEYVSHLFASYADAAGNELSIQAKANSDVSFIQANVTKDVFPLYNYMSAIRIGLLEFKYAEKLPFTLKERYDRGVDLKWELALNQNTYFGAAQSGRMAYGLVNDPNVPAASSPQNGTQNGAVAGTAASSLWVNKAPSQIAADINAMITAAQALVQYDNEALVNHVLLPTPDFNYIATQQYYGVGPSGTPTQTSATILEWILQHNVSSASGQELMIYPCRQCIGAGVGGSNRAVAYSDKQEFLEMNITVPMQLLAMGTDFEKGFPSIISSFAGQFGPPKKLLTQSFAYLDGI